MANSAPSVEEEWRAILTGQHPFLRRGRSIFRLLPSAPRCKFCNAPFGMPGAALMGLVGRRPAAKNPRYCGACIASLKEGGAEVDVSLLFADVRGSTTMAERMSPTEFGALMKRFYRVGTDVLIDSDAFVDKFVGDEVIGLFVPGFAGAQHARRAVEAARKLLEATGHRNPGGPWLPVGAGVHTGMAFVGAVGATEGVTDFTALGDTVNVAARLASAAGPGEILVSEVAYAAARADPAQAEPRELRLKGHAQPVAVRAIRVAAT